MKIATERKKALVLPYWGEPGSSAQRFLLCERARSRNYAWQPITGNGEDGEDFLTIARREAEEESGLSVGPLKDLGIDFHFSGRFGRAWERAFAWHLSGNSPPSPTLDPKEHRSFAWYSQAEAESRLPFAHQKLALERAAIPFAFLELDEAGNWRHEGEAITHQRSLELLQRSLERCLVPNTEPGTDIFAYQARIGSESLPVVCADTAWFVQRLHDAARGEVELIGGRIIALDDDSFSSNGKNIFHARYKGERIRFLRSAYHALAPYLVREAGEYRLNWGGRLHQVSITP